MIPTNMRNPRALLLHLGLAAGILAWILVMLLAYAAPAHAQATVDLEIDITDPFAPEITWSTSGGSPSCAATGGWTGAKAPSGTETLLPITGSVTYGLDCTFAGASMVTLSWEEATEREDGSAYTNPAWTRLVWRRDGTIGDIGIEECMAGRPSSMGTDRPAGETMHTVTQVPPGAFSAVAFSVDTMGLCSDPSNVATTILQGEVQVSDSVSLTIPNAPAALVVGPT